MRASLRLTLVAFLAQLAMRVAHADTPVGILPTIDFKAYFPWLVWVSSEGHDAEFPAGFRYKLLSERSADSSTVEFALVRELPDGTKTVAIRGSGPLSKFDDASKRIVETMSRSVRVTFQRYDLRGVHDFAELQEKMRDFGWETSPVPK
jgi:hypothetical protein